jgi:hypothetical protein
MLGKGEERDVLYDLWRDDLAGAAPGCKGIENDDLVVLESGLELCFAVQHVSISPSTARPARLERAHFDAHPCREGEKIP